MRVSGKDRLSDTALDVLSGSVQSAAVEVPADWVRLFPPGGALEVDSLGLGAIGQPAPYAGSGGIPDNARIGDFYVLGGDDVRDRRGRADRADRVRGGAAEGGGRREARADADR